MGKSGLLDAALPLIKDGGTVGIYGIDDYGACTINPSRARGSFTYSQRHYDEAETHDQVIALIQQGKLEAGLFLDLERLGSENADLSLDCRLDDGDSGHHGNYRCHTGYDADQCQE